MCERLFFAGELPLGLSTTASLCRFAKGPSAMSSSTMVLVGIYLYTDVQWPARAVSNSPPATIFFFPAVVKESHQGRALISRGGELRHKTKRHRFTEPHR